MIVLYTVRFTYSTVHYIITTDDRTGTAPCEPAGDLKFAIFFSEILFVDLITKGFHALSMLFKVQLYEWFSASYKY